MPIEKKKEFLINCAYYGIWTAVIFFTVRFAFKYLLPFIVAYFVALMLHKPIKFISEKTKIAYKISSIICIGCFYAVAVTAIFMMGYQLRILVKNVFFILPQFYTETFLPMVENWVSRLYRRFAFADPQWQPAIDRLAESAGTALQNISVTVISKLSSVTTSLPSVFAGIIIAVVASFFISRDYENIIAFVKSKMPSKLKGVAGGVAESGVSTAKAYLRSYAIIMCITFCELSVGFLLLRVKMGIVIAFATAVFDILPVLGLGAVLWRWRIYSFAVGNTAFGAGLVIMYCIITVVRNIIEPKIVSGRVGLPPVVTLAAMFCGLKLMGVTGMILLPVVIVIVKQISSQGIIKINF